MEERWTRKDLGEARANVFIGIPLGGFLSLAIAACAATVFLPLDIEVDSLGQMALPAGLGLGRIGLVVVIFGVFAATPSPRGGRGGHPSDDRDQGGAMIAARTLHAQLHLLDRQVARADDGRLVCKVDDLELALDRNGCPYVTAILAGPLALGPRIGGVIGRLMVATTELFRPEEDPAPQRIAIREVAGIGSAITVGGDPQEAALERWARTRVIAPLSGSGAAGHAAALFPARTSRSGLLRMSDVIGCRVIDSEGRPVGRWPTCN
ncbi:hypothetical protein [Nonomuraea sp. bgisy101]|uniref:hypothetical protein n=1 Tax=Nonomuraea sp. bgisy101 TaxID=3413784 RepID=UPI003D72D133